MTKQDYERLEGLTPTNNPQSIWRQETGWEMIDGDTGMSYTPLYVPREWT